ncbi:MAG: hypothetical protein R3F49_12640 [Planctomycetota bacterium]
MPRCPPLQRLAPALLVGTLALALPPAAWTQNDECAGALPALLGDTPFETASATVSPEPWAWPCLFTTGPDVWFEFIAPESGSYAAETCGAAHFDTVLAVLRGACGALSINMCSDDACGAQSLVRFSAEAGERVLLRVGGRSGASGPGTLTIRRNLPTLNLANGHTYQVVGGERSWHAARALAEEAMHLGRRGHLATIEDAAENAFIQHTLDARLLGVAWLGGYQDRNDPTYAEPFDAWRWVTNEPWSYTNWSSGEPNNQNGIEDFLSTWQLDEWNDAQPAPGAVHSFVIEWETAEVGVEYCMPAVLNSTGQRARLAALGRDEVALGDLALRATDMPPGAFGSFLVGGSAISVPAAGGGQGELCVGGPLGRFLGPGTVRPADPGGVAMLELDLARIPGPGGTFAVLPGQTWRFQRWYRDANPQVTSNFTSAVAVTFR